MGRVTLDAVVRDELEILAQRYGFLTLRLQLEGGQVWDEDGTRQTPGGSGLVLMRGDLKCNLNVYSDCTVRFSARRPGGTVWFGGAASLCCDLSHSASLDQVEQWLRSI